MAVTVVATLAYSVSLVLVQFHPIVPHGGLAGHHKAERLRTMVAYAMPGAGFHQHTFALTQLQGVVRYFHTSLACQYIKKLLTALMKMQGFTGTGLHLLQLHAQGRFVYQHIGITVGTPFVLRQRPGVRYYYLFLVLQCCFGVGRVVNWLTGGAVDWLIGEVVD